MTRKPHRRSTSGRAAKTHGANGTSHQMSRASKVAIASAAGVLAATAAGLATTKTGRRITRNVRKAVSPVMHKQLNVLVDTVEASLAEAGVLQMIPTRVRKEVLQRLGVRASAMGNGAAQPRRNRSSRSPARSGRRN